MATDPVSEAGFERMASNKYLVPVTGRTRDGTLEIPEVLYDELAANEYGVQRARVAKPDDASFSMFSGVLAQVEPETNLRYGVRVPAYMDLTEQRNERILSEGSNYIRNYTERDADSVFLTFFNKNVPPFTALEAMGHEVIDVQDAGVVYWTGDEYVIKLDELDLLMRLSEEQWEDGGYEDLL